MAKRTKELWHQLDNETNRAYEAFKVFLYMAPVDRTVVGCYREWAMKPDKRLAPVWFQDWSRNHAWQERARAHDHHIELIREEGMEEAIKEEASFQARQVEQLRFRYQEMLSVFYERAMGWLEDSDNWQGLRPMDVVNIVRLHGEALDRLGEPEPVTPEADWDEKEEDDEFGRKLVEEVDAQAEDRRAEADATEQEEGIPPEDPPEDT